MARRYRPTRWTVKEDSSGSLVKFGANHPHVHFHACGDYAPGEIGWMLRDHSFLDDIPLWETGRLKPENFSVPGVIYDRIRHWQRLSDRTRRG